MSERNRSNIFDWLSIIFVGVMLIFGILLLANKFTNRTDISRIDKLKVDNSDEKQILEVLNKSFEAMRNKDIAAFLDCYTTDNPVLKEIGGRETIIRNMLGIKKELTHHQNVEIKFRKGSATLGLEAMLADATVSLRETKESLWWYGFIEKEIHSRRIYSFKNEDGKWKIFLIMDHSTGEEYINDPEIILESTVKKFSSDEIVNIIYSFYKNRSKDINDAKAKLAPILDTLISDFRRAVELKPSSTEGYYWIAAISFIKGEFTEAINSLKRAIEIAQDDSNVNLKLGNKYYRAMLHCTLGQVYFQENRIGEALNEFKIAIDQNPEYSHAHSFISRIYQMRGDIETARIYRLKAFRYNPLFRMEPLYPDSRVKQAQEHFSLANLNPSRQEEFLRQAIELDGEFVSAYYYLGLLYSKNGEWQKAIDCMNKVINLDSGQEDPYWELGTIYGMIYNAQREKRALELSIQNFAKAIEMNPNIHEIYGNLALSYFFKGNPNKAVEIMKKAKALCPYDPTVNFYMAMFLKKKADSNMFIMGKRRKEIYEKEVIPLLQLALDFCTDTALRADIEFLYNFVKKQK